MFIVNLQVYSRRWDYFLGRMDLDVAQSLSLQNDRAIHQNIHYRLRKLQDGIGRELILTNKRLFR